MATLTNMQKYENYKAQMERLNPVRIAICLLRTMPPIPQITEQSSLTYLH